MAFIQQFTDIIKLKVNNAASHCRQAIIHTRDAIIWKVYTQPKLYITNKLNIAKRAATRTGHSIKYVLYTCPKVALIWLGDSVVLIFYTKPREYAIKGAIVTKNGAIAMGNFIVLILYKKPKECVMYLIHQVTCGIIETYSGIKYVFYTTPRNAIVFGCMKIKQGANTAYKATKYATYTYPKTCIVCGIQRTKLFIHNANLWLCATAHRVKVVIFIRPVESINNVYNKAKNVAVSTKNNTVVVAKETKHILYDKPKVYTSHKLYQIKQCIQNGWKYTRETTTILKQKTIYLKDVSIQKIRNFWTLPVYQKVIISFILGFVLLLILQAMRISVDIYHGEYEKAESKAGIFYTTFKAISRIVQYVAILIWYMVCVIWEKSLHLMYIISNYLWIELKHMSRGITKVLGHITQWLINLALYVYGILRITYLFLYKTFVALSIILEKYNSYRDLLFLGFVALMSVYCTGLMRDYMSDDDRSENNDDETDSNLGIDDVDKEQQESIINHPTAEENIVRIGVPSCQFIDHEVDFSDSDEEFLPHENDITESRSSVDELEDDVVYDHNVQVQHYIGSGDDNISEDSCSDVIDEDNNVNTPKDIQDSDTDEDNTAGMEIEEFVEYITLPPDWGN